MTRLSWRGRFAAVLLSDGALAPIVDALAKPKLHDQASGYLTTLADGGATLFARALQDPNPRVREEVGERSEPQLRSVRHPAARLRSRRIPTREVATAVDRALARSAIAPACNVLTFNAEPTEPAENGFLCELCEFCV